eukprot:1156099-Pelagomonas_calceolata.AAC.1
MDSLSSLHQLKKQLLYPEKQRHHVQRNVVKAISNFARTSQGHIFFLYKCKYQASLKNNNLIDTSIPRTGPDGNPFYNIAWLAQEETRPSAPESFFPVPNLMYFPDLKDALKSHVHSKNGLEYADRKSG